MTEWENLNSGRQEAVYLTFFRVSPLKIIYLRRGVGRKKNETNILKFFTKQRHIIDGAK